MTTKDNIERDLELSRFWRDFSHNSKKSFEADKANTLQLQPGDARFEDNTLKLRSDIPPLKANQRLILETILILKPNFLTPKRVMEFGFGSGDNLHNIMALAPDVETFGIDVCRENEIWALGRNPGLEGRVKTWDATWPHSRSIPKNDLTFSNTVLMHINETAGYLTALANMFLYSTDYVLIMENWETHAYMADVLDLFKHDMLGWDDLFLYHRYSPELQRPHLMVASRVLLTDTSLFVPLYDYHQQLWQPLVAAPDSKIGKLPGEGVHLPMPAFER